MIGVVLSGGQSSRMGQDKGLINKHGKVWAKIACEKLAALSTPVIISISNLQLQEYLNHFEGRELLIDRPDLEIHGPLAGIMSANLQYPDQDILVLACDMVNMQSHVLEKLGQEFHALRPNAIAFKGANIEPLCAIYSAQGLEEIRARYHSASLEKQSMHYVLEVVQATYLPLPKEWQSFFNNFNQPGELQTS